MKNYGKELTIDLHDCDVCTFTRKSIKKYFKELCELIDMEREKLYWWDYWGDPGAYKKAPPHLQGISAVQFIKTSNITIHALDKLKRIYINIFSCKNFNQFNALEFTESFFGGILKHYQVVERK